MMMTWHHDNHFLKPPSVNSDNDQVDEDDFDRFEPPSVIVAVRHKVDSGQTRWRLWTTLAATSCEGRIQKLQLLGEVPPRASMDEIFQK